MKALPQINDGETFEIIGNVTVNGSIGSNARLIVKNGTITINGDIKAYSEIIASTLNVHTENYAVFFSKNKADLNYSIYIYGHVDSSAVISVNYGEIYINTAE